MQFGHLVQKIGRQRHLLDGDAGGTQVGGGAVDSTRHLGIEIAIEIAARQADDRQRPVAVQGGFVAGHRTIDRRRVGRIGAGQHAQQPRTVAGSAGQGPDDVERCRHRHRPVTAHPAVGRNQPDDAGYRCRTADRATGIGTQRGMHEPAAYRGARTAR